MFEALAHHYEMPIPSLPLEWLPLSYLFDPDLPLFPLLQFHALAPDLPSEERPSHTDRVFGYVQHLSIADDGVVARLVVSKNLTDPANAKYLSVVEGLVRERLGLGDPVTLADISHALKGPLVSGNALLRELWDQVVPKVFGGRLPFGQMWDEVLGLARFVASYRSDGGRKGELIQTHFFAQAFGEKIATSSGIHCDYYLLPTFSEMRDLSNPLSRFSRFASLRSASISFCRSNCEIISVRTHKFSAFRMKKAGLEGMLNTEKLVSLFGALPNAQRQSLEEALSAFNRGPNRTIIAILMINDLACSQWNPATLTAAEYGALYHELRGAYQSSKVIHLYAQQCFGATEVLPLDNWIETFTRWPLNAASERTSDKVKLLTFSQAWGKIERLIWVAAQARKVHSSVAAEILWCIRLGDTDRNTRGPNPLSCGLCLPVIRQACPGYLAAASAPISFNTGPLPGGYRIETSSNNDTDAGQKFAAVVGRGAADIYSGRDRSSAFRAYPQAGAVPGNMSEFIDIYLSEP